MQLALQDGSVEGYSHCILICTAAIYVRQYAPYCDSPPNAYEDEDDDDGGVFARKAINIRCVIINEAAGGGDDDDDDDDNVNQGSVSQVVGAKSQGRLIRLHPHCQLGQTREDAHCHHHYYHLSS